MSKQVYIDENGNEIQVSGTVNTADMMPMSGNDSTKVATAIGSLSTLTTSDKSSLVGAVNEVNSGKQDKITVVTTVTGSTDNTGNMVVPDIAPSTHMLLSAYKVRSSPNTDIAMSSIGVNGSQTAYLVHLALTDGSAYASKSNVVLKIAYITI